MHISLIGLVLSLVLMVWTLLGLRGEWTEKKVKHRWYFRQNRKQYDYATRGHQPVKYWSTLGVQLLWAAFCGMIAVMQLRGLLAS